MVFEYIHRRGPAKPSVSDYAEIGRLVINEFPLPRDGANKIAADRSTNRGREIERVEERSGGR